MPVRFYLRPALRPKHCIVEPCRSRPRRYGCFCEAHFMRWYLHGTFRTKREQRDLDEDRRFAALDERLVS